MACGTVIGATLDEDDFGISAAEQGLVTQSISVTRKQDKKEVKDHCGEVVNLAYYNLTADISISGYGSNQSLTIGGVMSMVADNVASGSGIDLIPQTSAIVVKEVTITRTNEDFVKTDIKAMSYDGISAL